MPSNFPPNPGSSLDIWGRNFGACLSVPWISFLQVATTTIETLSTQSKRAAREYDNAREYENDGTEHIYAHHESGLEDDSESEEEYEGLRMNSPNGFASPRSAMGSGAMGSGAMGSGPVAKQGMDECHTEHPLMKELHTIFTQELPLQRVLRYTLLEPQRQEMEAAAGVPPPPYPPISFRSYQRYLSRFGPTFPLACARAALTCFPQPTISRPTPSVWEWFHGAISRTEGDELMRGVVPGTFLIRFSEARPESMTLVYMSSSKRIKNILMFNLGGRGGRGYGLVEGGGGTTFDTVAEFLGRHTKLRKPVVSRLSSICVEEIETVRFVTMGEGGKKNDDTESEEEEGFIGKHIASTSSVAPPPKGAPKGVAPRVSQRASQRMPQRGGYEGDPRGDYDGHHHDSHGDYDSGDNGYGEVPRLTHNPAASGFNKQVQKFGKLAVVPPRDEGQYGSFTQQVTMDHAVDHAVTQEKAGYGGFAGGASSREDPYSSFTQVPQPPQHAPAQTATSVDEYPEVVRFLGSADAALARGDLDVVGLLVRSLRSLVDGLPGAVRQTVSKRIEGIEAQMEGAEEEEGGEWEVLDDVKGLAMKGELKRAWEGLEKVGGGQKAACSQWGVVVARLKGDLGWMREREEQGGWGGVAEEAYLKGVALGRKCRRDGWEQIERVVALYSPKYSGTDIANQVKQVRSTSLLQKVGGSGADLAFDYSACVVAMESNLGKIYYRRREFGKGLGQVGKVVGMTYQAAKRSEVIDNMYKRGAGDEEFSKSVASVAGDGVAAKFLDMGLSVFAGWHRGKGADPAALNRAVAWFDKAVLAARLAGDTTIEARGCGNLATCYHHLGDNDRSILGYLECLVAFRIGAAEGDGAMCASEKKILNAFTLRLMDEGEFSVARVFCLMQVKVAVDRGNLDVLKERLTDIEKGEGKGGGRGPPLGKPPIKKKVLKVAEVKEEEKEKDMPPGPPGGSSWFGSGKGPIKVALKVAEVKEKVEEDDDMPPGPPGGGSWFGKAQPAMPASPPPIAGPVETRDAADVWLQLCKLSGHDVEAAKMTIDAVFVAAWESFFLDDDDMPREEEAAFKSDIDRNGDGEVSMAEFNKFFKKYRKENIDMRRYLALLASKKK